MGNEFNGAWWMSHYNLARVAEFLNNQGQDVSEIVYMLEKPWKYNEEFEFLEKNAEAAE